MPSCSSAGSPGGAATSSARRSSSARRRASAAARGDRGLLPEARRCSPARSSTLGRLEEAERLALEAVAGARRRKTRARAWPRPRRSVDVRAAQGRDDEAEELIREALAIAQQSPFTHLELEPLELLATFLRERGREDEAAIYETARRARPSCRARVTRIRVRARPVRAGANRRRSPDLTTPRPETRRSPSPGGRSGRAPPEVDPRAASPRRTAGASSRCGSRTRCRRSGCGTARRRASTPSAVASASANGSDLEERPVARRVHVREVEHGSHPADAPRDLDHVVDRSEIAHAPHDLDAEGHGTALALQPLAERPELLDDRVDRVLSGSPEQEAGVEDDDLRAARSRDAGAPVERADGRGELAPVVSRWPMKPNSGACTESAMSRSRASSPSRSANG